MELRQPWLACGSRSRLCRLATPRACNPQPAQRGVAADGAQICKPMVLAGCRRYRVRKHSQALVHRHPRWRLYHELGSPASLKAAAPAHAGYGAARAA